MISFKILPRKKLKEIWLTKNGFQKNSMEERVILITNNLNDLGAVWMLDVYYCGKIIK